MSTKDPKNRNKNTAHRTARVDWPLVERVLSTKLIRSVYLYGPPGIGKTYSAYHKGRTEDGVYACTLTEETPALELRGTWLPNAEGLVWHDGPVARAMREGARLVLNEISHASDDVLAFLYPVIESPETARVTLPTNETLTPSPGFSVVVTDNLPPDDLPPALQDRFETILEVTEPHPEALSRLSPDLREAARRSFALEADRRVSLRAWLMLERLRPEFGLEEACIIVFGAERGSQIHDALHFRLRSEEA